MKSAAGDDDDREYPCLVRVTDGDKAQFSTKVRLIQSKLITNLEIKFVYCTGRTRATRLIPRNIWKPP